MKGNMERSPQEDALLHNLRHYRPAQSPLKDFSHHNTLHALQSEDVHSAMHKASIIFGYRTYLPLTEYRRMFQEGKISKSIIEKVITEQSQSTKIKVDFR